MMNVTEGRDGSSRVAISPRVADATRRYLDMHLGPLREAAAQGGAGLAHARRVAAVYDGLLSSYFLASCARLQQEGSRLPARIALLAVGGYGRGTLGLGSDLDIVILVPDATDPNAHALAETLLYPLWDAGVAIGHAVRTPDELVALARQDLRTATTLLDARVVAGDARFADEALARGWRALFDRDLNAFLDSMLDEMAARHGRYGASVYLLEPDLKHGRGALRDLDIARWALRARFRCRDLGDALRIGAISQHDATLLEAAREFVWRARGVLHARAGRRTDRLTFDEQEECARALGFVDPAQEASDPMRAVGAGAERFMQAYYRHARTVATTVERIVEMCRPGRDTRERSPRADRVAEGIERFEGTLTFSDPEALHRDPSLALRIIERSLVLGLPLHPRVRDVIAQAAVDPAFGGALRAAPGAGPLFRRLIEHSARATLRARGVPVSATEQGASSVLAEMHDLGLLLAMVPEFGPVTGRVHHDIYHVYTVDVHSVAAVDRLHQVARGEMRDDFAIAARTLADLERRDLVCLATLLHDVGKGRGGDHSAVGAELAVPIARRMGLGEDDARQVAWLVRQHLALYHFATRRDLTDPATLAQVTTLVGDSWRLRALYLVTVADLSTTSPTAMNSWKARMLDELLRRGEDALSSASTGITAHVDDMRRRAIAIAPDDERASVATFLESMPQRYVLAATPETAVRHARIVRHARAGEPFVHIAPLDGTAADLAEVVIVAPDRPGLLSRLAAMLYINRLDVQGAQVYSRELASGVDAVDVFTVRRLENDPGALARLASKLPRDLVAMLSTDEDFARAMASRAHAGIPRPEPAVRTEVEIDNMASDRFTIIEVFGRDRPGLLYAVASALYALGLSISLSKVNTEGRRVADVFYVSDHGQKIDRARFAEISERLKAAVDGG